MLKCAGKIILALSLLMASVQTTHSFEVDLPDNLFKDWECMAVNLHHEARGEGAKGMIAVANVVMNRVAHGGFPDSVCGVIYQKHQFSWVKTVKNVDINRASTKAKIIAYEAVVNKTLKDKTGGAVLFHSGEFPGWKNVRKTVSIGNHTFYTFARRQNAQRDRL